MHSYQQVKALIKQFTGQANTLVIPRVFIDFTGDHLAALLLSQILYWSDRTADPDGWFYKTADEWQAELGMTAYQVKRAAAVLAPLGIESRVRKVKLTPKSHYRVDMQRFTDLFMKFLENEETSKSKNQFLENQETSKSMESEETSKSYIGTETTTKTTSPTAATNEKQLGGGDDEFEKKSPTPYSTDMYRMLRTFKIGASSQLIDIFRERRPGLDVETVRLSIENQLADNMTIGAIVKWLREDPPEPGKPYQRARAAPKAATPLPTRPPVPTDLLTPSQIAERARLKRPETKHHDS